MCCVLVQYEVCREKTGMRAQEKIVTRKGRYDIDIISRQALDESIDEIVIPTKCLAAHLVLMITSEKRKRNVQHKSSSPMISSLSVE